MNIKLVTMLIMILGGAAFIFIIIVLLNPDSFAFFPMIRESMTALSALAMVLVTSLLACATFAIVDSNNKQEKSRRHEERINEILQWAQDVGLCLLRNDVPLPEEQLRRKLTTYDHVSQYLNLRYTTQMGAWLAALRIGSVYIQSIANNLCPSLQELVNASIENLRRSLRLWYRYTENKERIEHHERSIKVAMRTGRFEWDLYHSIVQITEEIGAIKKIS